MVPALGYPPGTVLAAETDGFLDTGFTCRLDHDALIVTGPPAGITGVGGYRFQQPALETEIAAIDPAATLLAVPDGLLGLRLAGSTPDRQAMIDALQARGLNPLLNVAFRPHPPGNATQLPSPSSLTGY